MKILVGVLHCIENEFGQCLEAIDNQTLPAHERFVISNLPNKEAHDTLYQSFMDRADDVDLFVKIDADMVISRPTFFYECAERFSRRDGLQHLQIALDDWLTKSRIMGLHVYRSTHKWKKVNEKIFVDTVDQPHQRVDDWFELAPAAVHCADPSCFQAFHFGLHKGVKFIQVDRASVQNRWRVTHWNHFENLEKHFFDEQDRRVGLAVLGFHEAVRKRWGSAEVDFFAEQPRKKFDELKALSDNEVFRLSRVASLPGGAFIPHHVRFELCSLHVSEDYSVRSLIKTIWRIIRNTYRRECPAVSKMER